MIDMLFIIRTLHLLRPDTKTLVFEPYIFYLFLIINSSFFFYRNLSQGSSDTGFYGSMEKEKSRRKKLDEGRVDPELVIKELMEGVDLDKVGQDEAETSGLQLFVGKDGTFTFDKSSSRKKDYEPVVMF
eukprot:TRINITY_DN3668_c0_g1_i2.p2 TRINITY_DN3668_c0_g1~~TRINITY_DN3668_c0_g1_i2.p2  ORF type:complete len:129 (+),score=22.88 TRINITY_DN3668_c0_g1_i2:363-749(+)